MEHFQYWEFDCKCSGCMAKGEAMQSSTLRMLDTAREVADVPFVINSGMRCEAHNKAEGGSDTSSHLVGYAADIATPDSKARQAILLGLIMAGFTRIGIAKTFIHADNDPGKPPGVCWLYS